MKCPICEGDIRFSEDVKGTYSYKIYQDGTVAEDSDFYGSFLDYLNCTSCGAMFGYEYDEKGKIRISKE